MWKLTRAILQTPAGSSTSRPPLIFKLHSFLLFPLYRHKHSRSCWPAPRTDCPRTARPARGQPPPPQGLPPCPTGRAPDGRSPGRAGRPPLYLTSGREGGLGPERATRAAGAPAAAPGPASARGRAGPGAATARSPPGQDDGDGPPRLGAGTRHRHPAPAVPQLPVVSLLLQAGPARLRHCRALPRGGRCAGAGEHMRGGAGRLRGGRGCGRGGAVSSGLGAARGAEAPRPQPLPCPGHPCGRAPAPPRRLSRQRPAKSVLRLPAAPRWARPGWPEVLGPRLPGRYRGLP